MNRPAPPLATSEPVALAYSCLATARADVLASGVLRTGKGLTAAPGPAPPPGFRFARPNGGAGPDAASLFPPEKPRRRSGPRTGQSRLRPRHRPGPVAWRSCLAWAATGPGPWRALRAPGASSKAALPAFRHPPALSALATSGKPFSGEAGAWGLLPADTPPGPFRDHAAGAANEQAPRSGLATSGPTPWPARSSPRPAPTARKWRASHRPPLTATGRRIAAHALICPGTSGKPSATGQGLRSPPPPPRRRDLFSSNAAGAAHEQAPAPRPRHRRAAQPGQNGSWPDIALRPWRANAPDGALTATDSPGKLRAPVPSALCSPGESVACLFPFRDNRAASGQKISSMADARGLAVAMKFRLATPRDKSRQTRQK